MLRDVLWPVIKIYVGPGRQEFRAYRELLCEVSSYFRGALLGHLKEAQEKMIDLDEEDPAVFATFITWLYHRRLPSIMSCNESTGKEEADRSRDERRQQHLAELWILGDRRGIPGLQNAAIAMLDLSIDMRRHLTTSIVTMAYEETPPKSKLREYLACVTARLGLIQDFDHEDLQHAEFLAAVCKQLSQLCLPYQSEAPTNKLQHTERIQSFLAQ